MLEFGLVHAEKQNLSNVGFQSTMKRVETIHCSDYCIDMKIDQNRSKIMKIDQRCKNNFIDIHVLNLTLNDVQSSKPYFFFRCRCLQTDNANPEKRSSQFSQTEDYSLSYL